MSAVVFAEPALYIEETRQDEETAPVFSLSDLVHLYQSRMEQLGVHLDTRVHSTRLKQRLLSQFPDMRAHTKGRDILMAFEEDIGGALDKALELDSDSGPQTAEYVFIRHDAHRGPLRPPYEGPFRVLETGDKHFVVDMGGKSERLSIDRLKQAHLDVARPIELAQPPRRGRPPTQHPPPAPLPLEAPTLHAPHSCHGGTPATVVSPQPPVKHSRSVRLIRPPRR